MVQMAIEWDPVNARCSLGTKRVWRLATINRWSVAAGGVTMTHLEAQLRFLVVATTGEICHYTLQYLAGLLLRTEAAGTMAKTLGFNKCNTACDCSYNTQPLGLASGQADYC